MRLLKQQLPVVVVACIGGQLVTAVKDNALLSLVIGVATAVLAVFVYARMVRWSEHRAPEEVGVAGAPARLGLGMLIGVAWFGAVIGNIAVNGDYRVEGFGSVTGPIGLFGFMSAAAVTEELIFRGVQCGLVGGRFGTWMALVVTSVLFGAWHLLNPDATLWGVFVFVFVVGGFLVAVFAVSRF